LSYSLVSTSGEPLLWCKDVIQNASAVISDAMGEEKWSTASKFGRKSMKLNSLNGGEDEPEPRRILFVESAAAGQQRMADNEESQ
jgi:hypothetical protein